MVSKSHGNLYSDKLTIYEKKKNIKRVKWLLFFVVILQNVIHLFLEALFSFIPNPPHNYIRIGIIEIISIMLPLIFFFRNAKHAENNKEKLRLNKFTLSQGIIIFFMAAAGQFVMIALNAPATFIQYNILNIPAGSAIPLAVTYKDVFTGIIMLAIIPAILEELLMRGLILSTLEKQSTIVAVFFSTIMFVILHANIFEFLGLLFLGFMLVFVLLRTNSLYAAMLYHFTTNFTAILIEYILNKIKPPDLQIIIFFLGAIIVFMVFTFLFRSFTSRIKRHSSHQTFALLLQSFINIPVLLSIVIIVIVQYITIIQKIV